MIKTLLATIIVTLSCSGTSSLKVATPKRANVIQEISGFYCLKDTLGSMDLQSFYFGDTTSPFRYYVYSYDENLFIPMNNMTISQQVVSNVWYLNIVNSNYDESNGTLNDQYIVTVNSHDLSAQGNKAKNFYIYVSTPYTVNSQTGNYGRFMEFFTNYCNVYMTSYTGWYSFNDVLGDDYQLLGNFSANNTLYGYLDYVGNTNILFQNPERFYPDRPQGVSYYLYKDGSWQNQNKNVYMQVTMFPKYVYDNMTNHGVFAFIPYDIQVNSFQDFFFSIMDSPVYYLYSLFNFNLFGMNLFFAFCGLITLCIVVIVIKKVW